MVTQRVRAYAVLFGFFVLGGVGGVAGGRAYTQHELAAALFTGDPQTREAMFLLGVSKDLNLSHEQTERVAEVLRRHRAARDKMMDQVLHTCGKPLEALHQEVDAEMSAILDPSQAARWREMRAQRHQQRTGR